MRSRERESIVRKVALVVIDRLAPFADEKSRDQLLGLHVELISQKLEGKEGEGMKAINAALDLVLPQTEKQEVVPTTQGFGAATTP